MANDLKIDADAATLMIQALADQFDAASTNNTLKIYSVGSGIPTDADTAITDQTLLVTINLPTPAFGTASAGAVSKTGTWSGTVTSAGEAAFYRLEDDTGNTTIQGTVGLDTGTFDLEFSDVTWSVDGTVTVDTFTLTMPEQ